jgi:hypothetical protein
LVVSELGSTVGLLLVGTAEGAVVGCVVAVRAAVTVGRGAFVVIGAWVGSGAWVAGETWVAAGVGAAQAARIMPAAAMSKGIWNNLLDMISPSYLPLDPQDLSDPEDLVQPFLG